MNAAHSCCAHSAHHLRQRRSMAISRRRSRAYEAQHEAARSRSPKVYAEHFAPKRSPRHALRSPTALAAALVRTRQAQEGEGREKGCSPSQRRRRCHTRQLGAARLLTRRVRVGSAAPRPRRKCLLHSPSARFSNKPQAAGISKRTASAVNERTKAVARAARVRALGQRLRGRCKSAQHAARARAWANEGWGDTVGNAWHNEGHNIQERSHQGAASSSASASIAAE